MKTEKRQAHRQVGRIATAEPKAKNTKELQSKNPDDFLDTFEKTYSSFQFQNEFKKSVRPHHERVLIST